MDGAHVDALRAAGTITERARTELRALVDAGVTDPCVASAPPGVARLWYAHAPKPTGRLSKAIADVRDLVVSKGRAQVHYGLAAALSRRAACVPLDALLVGWLRVTRDPTILEAIAWQWLAAQGEFADELREAPGPALPVEAVSAAPHRLLHLLTAFQRQFRLWRTFRAVCGRGRPRPRARVVERRQRGPDGCLRVGRGARRAGRGARVGADARGRGGGARGGGGGGGDVGGAAVRRAGGGAPGGVRRARDGHGRGDGARRQAPPAARLRVRRGRGLPRTAARRRRAQQRAGRGLRAGRVPRRAITLCISPAGTGKTHVAARVARYAARVLCLAPSWKAVAVLRGKLSGGDVDCEVEFRTVQGFCCTDDVPDVDLVVVDELSMLTMHHVCSILRAYADHARARLLFLGDDMQLPCIGAGSPIRDLAAQLSPVRLVRCMRTEGRELVAAATAVRDGRPVVAAEEGGAVCVHAGLDLPTIVARLAHTAPPRRLGRTTTCRSSPHRTTTCASSTRWCRRSWAWTHRRCSVTAESATRCGSLRTRTSTRTATRACW